MSVFLVLVLCGLTASSGVHVIDGVSRQDALNILNNFDCRGYHDGTAVVIANVSGVHASGFKAVHYIAPSNIVDKLRLVDVAEGCSLPRNVHPLHRVDTATGFRIVAMVENVVDDDDLEFSRKCNAVVVPLSLQALIAPRVTSFPEPNNAAHARIAPLTKGVRDPRIEALVEQVASDSLRDAVEHLADVNNYYSRQSQSDGAYDAMEWLLTRFTAEGFTATLDPFRSDMSDNVIADLPGKEDPSKIIIVGAHYDSRSTNVNDPTQRAPGADDNASGTAMLLELARILASYTPGFKHTIRLMAFGGEEQGLLGSRDYARRAAAVGMDIVAMFNGDMLGWTLPGQDMTIGMKDRSITEWLNEEVKELARTYVPDIGVGDSPSCCSDYLSFYENGFPTVGYFENPGSASDYPHYHRSTDLPQYLNFLQVQKISQCMMAATATFAVPMDS